MSFPTPDIYYPLNKDSINYNNEVQNWSSGSPVYDASINNTNTYISKTNYRLGRGSLELNKRASITFGTTLYTVNVPVNNFSGISVSSNELRMVACAFQGTVYYSKRTTGSDSWGTFTQITGAPDPILNPLKFYRIALKLDGTRGVVCAYESNYIYTFNWPSSDTAPSGWKQILDTIGRNYQGVSMTEDGNKIVACAGSDVFYSTWNGSNYGILTLITNRYSTILPIGICISRNGDRFIYGDQTYGSQNWYLCFWDGSTVTSKTKIRANLSSETSTSGRVRSAYFNNDSNILLLSYQGNNVNMEIGTYNNTTNTYDSFNPIPSSLSSTTRLDGHGLCIIDNGSNLSIYLLPYSSYILYIHGDGYNYNTLKYNPYIGTSSSATVAGPSSSPQSLLGIMSCALSQDQLKFVWADYTNHNLYWATRTSITSNWETPATFNGNVSKEFTIVQLTPDGSRGVTCVGWISNTTIDYVYYFTWNTALNKYNNIIPTLDKTPRDYRGLAITADGSRMVACSSKYIFLATWNGSNYSSFTRTLVSLSAGENNDAFQGMAISSDGDRIVYGYNNNNYNNNTWYISFWNGTNYNDGTSFLTRTTNVRIPCFNYDASILFLSYFNKTEYSVEYGFVNGSTYDNFKSIPTTIMPDSKNCHGLYYIESGVNSNLYVVAYNTTIYTIPFWTIEQNMRINKSITPSSNGITFSCWFRSNANDLNACLFEFGNYNYTSCVNLYIQNNHLALRTINQEYSYNQELSTDTINDNTWNNAIITMQPSTSPTQLIPTVSANGIYACRLVNSSYSGAIFNLRRPSDNATQDFYVDVTGQNITTGSGGTGNTLSSWSSSYTYVTKWYDQSGQAKDASQNVVSSQPVFIPSKGCVDFSYYIWYYPFSSTVSSGVSNYASGVAETQGYLVIPNGSTTCYVNNSNSSLYSAFNLTTDNSISDYFRLPTVKQNLKGYTFCFNIYVISYSVGMVFSLQNDKTSDTNTERICVYYDGSNVKIGTVSTQLYSVFTPTLNVSYFFVWTLDVNGNSNGYVINRTNSVKTVFTSRNSSETPYINTVFTNNRLLSDSNNSIGAPVYFNQFYYVDGILSQTELDTIYILNGINTSNLTYRYLNLPDGTVPYNNSKYTVITKHGDVNNLRGAWLGSGTQETSKANSFRINDNINYLNWWYGGDFIQGNNMYAKDNIVTYIYNGSSISIYINNVFINTVSKSGRSSTQNNNAIGKSPYSPKNYEYLNGQLYYLYIYPSDLPFSDRTIVESKQVFYSLVYYTDVKYYLNGTLKATITNKFFYPKITSWTKNYLGKSNLTSIQFIGNIDEFRVYNQLLSQTQITSLYNNDSSINSNYDFQNSNVYIVYPDSVDINNSKWGSTNKMGTGVTYYYWNDPYAYTNTIINNVNPIIFSYTYNASSSTTAYLYIIADDRCSVRQNGVVINTSESFPLNTNSTTYLSITFTTGNNVFEFLARNFGGPACLAVYCVNSTSTCLFSTNSTKAGWTAKVNGLFENGCQLSALL